MSQPEVTQPNPSLGDLVDQLPEGWTRVTYRGRAYGLARTTRAAGGAVGVFAQELGGSDLVSANFYRTATGEHLRPCEMPAQKVLDFLQGWKPDRDDGSSPTAPNVKDS